MNLVKISATSISAKLSKKGVTTVYPEKNLKTAD